MTSFSFSERPHAFLVTDGIKNMPLMQGTWVGSLGQEDPLEKEITAHSSLVNSMDRGAWWTIVHGVAKSQTWLSNWHYSILMSKLLRNVRGNLKRLAGFPDSSVGKESTCNARDPGSVPGLGRSAAECIGYTLQYSWASLVAQVVKNQPQLRL